MPVINLALGVWNFQKKITRLAESGSVTTEAVLEAFRHLESDHVSMAGYHVTGHILMADTGQIIESIDYPFSTIPAAQFATERLCQLFSEALNSAQAVPGGGLEQIIYSFSDCYITITPLAIEGLCLITLVLK